MFLKAPFRTRSAPFVERLKAAGAIVIGKSTTSELGWSGLSRSPLTGYTHNPWKHGHQAGASSCGAAAAAAAGYGPLHQGTGRRRIDPHSKPLLRRVRIEADLRARPARPGGQPRLHVACRSMITRDVRDAALMLKVMAERTLRITPAWSGAISRLRARWTWCSSASLRGKRIAFSRTLVIARAIRRCWHRSRSGALVVRQSLGAVVEEVTPDMGTAGPS